MYSTIPSPCNTSCQPLSVLILSSSGAGKSALQDATLAFCPPEDVVRLTSLTGKALFYQDPTSLRHRLLALAETAGGEEAVYAIRSLISEGELVVSTTVRDRGSGRPTTVENRVEGPTAVFCTTAVIRAVIEIWPGRSPRFQASVAPDRSGKGDDETKPVCPASESTNRMPRMVLGSSAELTNASTCVWLRSPSALYKYSVVS